MVSTAMLNDFFTQVLGKGRALLGFARADAAASDRLMTTPWPDIVAFYRKCEGVTRAIDTVGALARQIGEGPLAGGLFAWTSMHDLCIAQHPTSWPPDCSVLRVSPISENQLEFRYLDTSVEARQWHRTVDADDAMRRLLEFLDQLRWFPPDVLEAIAAKTIAKSR
jgi:hypothetical protein